MSEPPIVTEVRRLAQRAEREDQERRREQLIQFASALYDKATTYVNLVILAAYVGFFTVWSTVRGELTRQELLLSGLAISLSLAVFVLWEVFVMLYAARTLQHMSAITNAAPQDLSARLEENKLAQAKVQLRVRRFWFVALLATLVPGLLAACVLFVAFVRNLLQT